MIEVKISGRGGQGAVLASQVLATAFFEKGFYVQSFPSFGAERRGAPVSAFLRVDSKEITLRYSVQSPDWIVLFDANLLKNPMVMAGMSGKTCLLVNTGLTQGLEVQECKELLCGGCDLHRRGTEAQDHLLQHGEHGHGRGFCESLGVAGFGEH